MRKIHILSALLIIFGTAAAFGEELKELLEQQYVGKPVMVKIPFPTQNVPILLYPERDNRTDFALYSLKLEKAGIGMDVGTVAIIKEVDIREKEATFYLIGVGVEYPSGGILPELLNANVWGYGSGKVRVKLENPLEQYEDLMKVLNDALSIAVTTKSLISLDSLPAEYREAVEAGVVARGMNRQVVFLIMGDPTEILREFKDDSLKEAWLYEKDDFTTLMILFSDGRVTMIKEL